MRFNSNVRNIQRKIKNQQGIRMVDQTLLLLPSRRELQSDEGLHLLLPMDQFELNLFLGVAPPTSNEGVVRKKCAQKKKFHGKAFSSSSFAEESEGSNSVVPLQNLVDATTTIPSLSSKDDDDDDNNNNNVAVTKTSIIKLSFQEHHRRIPFEHQVGAQASFARLAEACTQFFGVKNIHRMILSYQDEDGDRIQLSTDAELSYALDHYAEKKKKNGSLPVLRLCFSVKPVKKQDDDITSVLPSSSFSAVVPDEESTKKKSCQRKLQDGDVIVLQAQREGGAYNLAFCKKDQTVIAARQPPPSTDEEEEEKKKKKKCLFRKNVQWVVSKCDKETDGDEEAFFLSCKAYGSAATTNDSDSSDDLGNKKKKQQQRQPNLKKNLRVLSNANVNHGGGRGVWARFVIAQSIDGQVVTLRSVGRSKLHPENNFLGIVKNNNDNKTVVAGDLNKNSDNTKFTLHFV